MRGQGGELRRGSETARASAGAANRDLGHGVSADSIKVGIAIIDYDSIADYLDYNHGDQKAVAQPYVDYINHHGGVGGRKIIPFHKTYAPRSPAGRPIH